MSHCRHTDIVFELIDLSHTRMDQVRCQMLYYRASVYKHETLSEVTRLIGELHILAGLFGDEALRDAFTDFEAMAKAAAEAAVPGECSLTSRVTMLLGSLDLHLSLIYKAATRRMPDDGSETLTAAVRAKRNDLLALVPAGSRQWVLFHSL